VTKSVSFWRSEHREGKKGNSQHEKGDTLMKCYVYIRMGIALCFSSFYLSSGLTSYRRGSSRLLRRCFSALALEGAVAGRGHVP
jgi:hypothetical protein